MFLGSYITYFTGNNERSSTSYRLVLPKKFRKELGNTGRFYLVKGLDGEIWGYNEVQWQKEAENRLKIPITELEGRINRRKFFSQAEECVLDTQGRFVISKELVEQLESKSEVLLIGAGDHFEIWNPEVWRKFWIQEGK